MVRGAGEGLELFWTLTLLLGFVRGGSESFRFLRSGLPPVGAALSGDGWLAAKPNTKLMSKDLGIVEVVMTSISFVKLRGTLA